MTHGTGHRHPRLGWLHWTTFLLFWHLGEWIIILMMMDLLKCLNGADLLDLVWLRDFQTLYHTSRAQLMIFVTYSYTLHPPVDAFLFLFLFPSAPTKHASSRTLPLLPARTVGSYLRR